jgi:hypothetical protein
MARSARRHATWEKLHESLRRTLAWLHACPVLSVESLIQIAWPIDPPTQKWARAQLRGWTTDGFITPVGDGSMYMVDAIGRERLAEGGRPTIEHRMMALSAQTGVAQAGAIAVALAQELIPEVAVGALMWKVDPFRGDDVRADANGGVYYRGDRGAVRADTDLTFLTLAQPPPPPLAPGHRVDWFALEIDSGTESPAQLRIRATRWGTRMRALYDTAPSGCWPYALWVVNGAWDRVGMIWRIWLDAAACPLRITTMQALRAGGALRPWSAIWRDEHGRPRSLNPFMDQETHWRFLESPQPTAATLEQAIAQWDGQHVPPSRGRRLEHDVWDDRNKGVNATPGAAGAPAAPQVRRYDDNV